MLYRVREDGSVLTQGQVRGLHPNTSFPAVWDQSVCDFIGIDPILASPQPEHTRFQSVVPDGVEQDSLGNWVEKWKVVDWEQEAIDAATEAQWASVRGYRNTLLADCDWTQVADAPVNSLQWAVYRQALRDITLQPDPFNITWPVIPSEETNNA